MLRWLVNLWRRSATRKVRAPNDGEFVYELPFEAGNAFSVVQGYGGTYSHTGESYFSIDFSMPENTPICAARSGVVYHVIDHFSEGGADLTFKPKANAIYVLHDDDTIAAYVHLTHSGACVRAGDFVSAGQTIGFSGNTGWSGFPHLHFHVSDAFYHRRLPTTFNTAEHQATIVEVDQRYARPVSDKDAQAPCERSDVGPRRTDKNSDAFAFCPELLSLCTGLVPELSSVGFEIFSDYSSIDAMHDVHGIEVCGIQDPETALSVTRFLLRRFPGWNAGWLHAPDSSSNQGWVARVQRDRDPTMEYWETD